MERENKGKNGNEAMPDRKYGGNAPPPAGGQAVKPPEMAQNPAPEDENGLKRRLMRHMAVAGGLIVVLLGLLLLFDHRGSQPEETAVSEPRFEKPVPVGKKTPVAPSETSSPEVPPVPPSAETQPPQMGQVETAQVETPEEEQSAPPVQKNAAVSPSTPTNGISAAADPNAAVKKQPAAATMSSSQKAAPPPPNVAAQPQLPSGQEQRQGGMETGKTAQVVRPAGTARTGAETERAEPEATAEPALLPSHLRPASVQRPTGYTLLAGTYLDAAQAEALQVALTSNGIPSTLETRVSVGPFKTRQEAEEARRKLKALGVDAPIVAPAKR